MSQDKSTDNIFISYSRKDSIDVAEFRSITKYRDFEILIDIFQGSGGLSESKRLGIPLLGNIPLDSSISKISDVGMPYVLEYPNSSIANKFNEIVSQILAR